MNKQESKKVDTSYEILMEKFQFHHQSVSFHAHMAKRIGEIIKENHEQEARESEKFNEEFFDEK